MYEKVLDDGAKQLDNEEPNVITIRIGDYQIMYDVYIPYHDDDCPKPGETKETDNCDCEKCREYTAYLAYHPKEAGRHINIQLAEYQFTVYSDKKDLLEWLDKLPSTFNLCSCGENLVKRDNWCSTCYIFRYERTEEEGGACCVCLENEGRWVKLSCKHIIHKNCYRHLVKDECPLCRNPNEELIEDPYLS